MIPLPFLNPWLILGALGAVAVTFASGVAAGRHYDAIEAKAALEQAALDANKAQAAVVSQAQADSDARVAAVQSAAQQAIDAANAKAAIKKRIDHAQPSVTAPASPACAAAVAVDGVQPTIAPNR